MKSRAIRHEFVQVIPDEVADDTLYISIDYGITIHKCMSGCGLDVALPLSPFQWKLIFDGDTVSLFPSVGNWSYPCRSHYWIERDTAVWAPAWSRAKIEASRSRDRALMESYFERASDVEHRYEQTQPPWSQGWLARVKGWFARLGWAS
jgi:hypothetical protein